jgi:hypothetical protein
MKRTSDPRHEGVAIGPAAKHTIAGVDQIPLMKVIGDFNAKPRRATLEAPDTIMNDYVLDRQYSSEVDRPPGPVFEVRVKSEIDA